MLHGSETWPVRKENKAVLQRAEMRMVRWMCTEDVQKDCQARKLSREDAMDCSRWKKLKGWMMISIGECFFWYWLTQVVLDKRL